MDSKTSERTTRNQIFETIQKRSDIMRNAGFYKFVKNEIAEHVAFANRLNLDPRTKDLLWWHTPNEGKRSKFEQFLLKIMGVRKGVSDFIIIHQTGKYKGLIIEMKNIGVRTYKKNGDPYFEDQHQFLEDMKKQGFQTCFANGCNEAWQKTIEFLNT